MSSRYNCIFASCVFVFRCNCWTDSTRVPTSPLLRQTTPKINTASVSQTNINCNELPGDKLWRLAFPHKFVQGRPRTVDKVEQSRSSPGGVRTPFRAVRKLRFTTDVDLTREVRHYLVGRTGGRLEDPFRRARTPGRPCKLRGIMAWWCTYMRLGLVPELSSLRVACWTLSFLSAPPCDLERRRRRVRPRRNPRYL